MAELATIQKWLTSIIVRPGHLPEKIRLADMHYQVNYAEIISGSENMAAEEKVGIYAKGYILRLMECMEAEFPALQHLLGEELFETFARAYLSRLPPNSFDLYDLGKNFPKFLEATQPASEISNTEAPLYALPAELARLERVISEVSRMPGLEGKKTVDITANSVFFSFGDTDFRVSPCLKLLRQKFYLKHYIEAQQRNHETQTPVLEQTYLAITRVNYAVSLHALEPWQWHFLEALQTAGNYLSAIESVAAAGGIAKDALLADLIFWLPVAEEKGLVFKP